MEINEEKLVKKVDNSSYRERFQFQLKVNDNIICQRYFKISRFNQESLNSEELLNVLGGYRGNGQEQIEYFGNEENIGIVQLIKRDLEAKSRTYVRYDNSNATKLTGFASKMNAYKDAKANGADENTIKDILLNRTNDETYVVYEKSEDDESEIVNPWDVTFSFSFIVDDEVVYEHIWDGSKYPKSVRNSVDLTNSKNSHPVVQMLNHGREDLVSEIIRKICDVCSNPEGDKKKTYVKSTRYTNDIVFADKSNINNESYKKYSYSTYNRDFVNMWRNSTTKKTFEYERYLNRFNLSLFTNNNL